MIQVCQEPSPFGRHEIKMENATVRFHSSVSNHWQRQNVAPSMEAVSGTSDASRIST